MVIFRGFRSRGGQSFFFALVGTMRLHGTELAPAAGRFCTMQAHGIEQRNHAFLSRNQRQRRKERARTGYHLRRKHWYITLSRFSRNRGSGGGGDWHVENVLKPTPPASFWFLFPRGKRNSPPQGRNPCSRRSETPPSIQPNPPPPFCRNCQFSFGR